MQHVHTEEAAVTSKKFDISACHHRVWHGHWAALGDHQWHVKVYLRDHHKAYYTFIGMYIQKYMQYYVSHRGEVLIAGKTYQLCYQKDCTSYRSVSIHPYLNYDASRAHRSDRGDNQKIDIFCLSPRGL